MRKIRLLGQNNRQVPTKNKSLGQHFLRDGSVVNKMIGALDKDLPVVEIGGGSGALTVPLAQDSHHVEVFEIDPNWVKVLSDKLSAEISTGQITIKAEDVLKASFKNDRNFQLISSLPYQATSPILHKLAIEWSGCSLAVLLMQKEVAEKIMEVPPKASYWYHFLRFGFAIDFLIKDVAPGAFAPPPKVSSAVLRLIRNQKRSEVEFNNWSDFLHRLFLHPRKMLRQVFDLRGLTKAEIEPTLRPGSLSYEQALNLYSVAKTSESKT